MTAPLEEFVKQLTDSGLVAPGKLESFVPPNAHPKSVEELVQELVKAGNLTPFQAVQVKAGKVKALILGNYTILDKIGAGGMGQVFKARHRRMDRMVAIKMLPPAMIKDQAALARFQREVKVAAKLFHPNIVPALDADQAGAVHFLVMEYVDGKDLSALVKKDGPVTIGKAVSYMLQAAKGLEFAHGEGVVHRDIKPANLLLDKKGTVRILDLGLARLEADGGSAQAELTGSGTIMGTVDYMAPEQGVSTKSADARADIYSLGCTLHYLLIGKPIYPGETTAAKLLAHHQQPIPALRTLRENVPENVEAVFRKMVAKKIEDRYRTMSEVVAELEHCQAALNAAAGSSTSVWISPAADHSSGISPNVQHRQLAGNENSVPLAVSEPQRKPGSKLPPWKNTKLLIGAGAAGFLLVLLGVIVAVRGRHGNEAAPFEVPNGNSVEAQPTTPGPQPAASALSGSAIRSAPVTAKAPFDATQAKAHQAAWAKYLGTTVEQQNSVGMTLVLIPPGEFLMGSTAEENAVGRKMAEDAQLSPAKYALVRTSLEAEMPQYSVALTKPYWLGRTEVTIGQFKRFVEASVYVTQAERFGFGNSDLKTADAAFKSQQKEMTWRTPGYAVTDDSPVTQVTWNDAVQFCNWLSDQEKLKPCYRQDANEGWILLASGTGYRLPTEAEWEYACRAGTTTQFSFGDDPAMLDIYGWFNENSDGSAHAMGLKVANPFGLFDMHGNVYEWCHDWFARDYNSKPSPTDPFGPSSGANRSSRGGSCTANLVNCRSAFRGAGAPSYRSHSYGFRVMRVCLPSALVGEGPGGRRPESTVSSSAPGSLGEPPAPTQEEGALPPKPLVAPFDAKQARAGQEAWAKYLKTAVEQKNSIGMTLVLIPPGEFLMGSTPEQNAAGRKMAEGGKIKKRDAWEWTCLKTEGPQHRVAITHPYRLGVTEVTVGAFRKFVAATKYVTEAERFGFGNSQMTKPDDAVTPEMKKMTWRAPGYDVTDDLPVTEVTWNDAVQFCNWLSDQEKLSSCYQHNAQEGWILLATGTGYRLPTEAEWEYACRAGTTTQFSFGDDPTELDAYGWFSNNSGGIPRVVGLKVANAFGLSDVHGNVLEWCHDWYAADYYSESTQTDPNGPSSGLPRAVRGGYWYYDPVFCRSAFRLGYTPTIRHSRIGLRALRVSAGGRSAAKMAPATSTIVAAPTKLATNINDAAFQAWMKTVAALPAEKQVEAVSKKLMELNPGFDGAVTGVELGFAVEKDRPKIENGVVTGLRFFTDDVKDISPVRALAGLKLFGCEGSSYGKGVLSDLSPLEGMSLTGLNCPRTQVADLSPLKAMPLMFLRCDATQVSDLAPLKEMPLNTLFCVSTRVSDLSPLRQMKLTNLDCSGTQVFDLSPLTGMPLRRLMCDSTQVSDLSPLKGMKLTAFAFTPPNIAQGIDVIRHMKSLKVLGIRSAKDSQFPPDEFWKKYDAGEFGKLAPAASGTK